MTALLKPEHEAFRQRARAWLAANAPLVDELAPRLEERFEQLRSWQGKLFEAGWLGLSWPVDIGGQGLTAVEQVLFNQELAFAEAPTPGGVIGLEVVGPSIVAFGTAEQKARYIPSLLSGREIWCQGFSEPEAGSDLASLRTRAVDDGEHFVVTGQKVWTSWAKFADRCALLARTDSTGPKHKGISYLLVDMHQPGITVRPLRQLTGEEEFGEVFFDEVRVPKENVLAGINQGWRVAMHTLEFERGPYVLKRLADLQVSFKAMLVQAGQLLAATSDDEGQERRALAAAKLGHCAVLLDTLEAQGSETMVRLAAGEPGPSSSLDKLFVAIVEQALYATGLDLLGTHRTVPTDDDGVDRARWIQAYLYSRAASIYGGSAEIQRNIVAERVLALPRA